MEGTLREVQGVPQPRSGEDERVTSIEVVYLIFAV